LKSSYHNFGGNSNDERYDNLCKNLNELASLGSKGKHIYTKVMKGVDALKDKYRKLIYEPFIRSHHILVASSSCNEVEVMKLWHCKVIIYIVLLRLNVKGDH
jgi:hypothetical protein